MSNTANAALYLKTKDGATHEHSAKRAAKLKRELAAVAALTAIAATLAFPRANRELVRFKHALRDLLGENGLGDRESFDYDEETGTYCWSLTEYMGTLNGAHMRAKRTFSLDPTKSLADEIARLKGECEQFGADARKVRQSVIGLGGEL